MDVTLPAQPPQACSNDECGRQMDMTRAVWWTQHGPVCCERCARQVTKDDQ